MFQRRTTNKASRQRQVILRGIFEENLRLGDAYHPRRASRRWFGRRFLLSLVLLITLAGSQMYPALSESTDGLWSMLWPAHVTVEKVRVIAARVPAATVPPSPPTKSAPARASDELADAEDREAFLPDQAGRFVAGGLELVGPPLDAAPLVSRNVNVRKLFGLTIKTIVIDAGHGGRDPGAVGSMGTQEKDITLDVARRLRHKLEQNSAYRILLVRDADVFISLNRRAAFANAHDTDLFVSIHVNYLPAISTNAIETYYFGPHQDQRTRNLAERENNGSEYTLSEFERTIRNVRDTIKLQESNALAHAIQRSLLRNIRRQHQKVLDTGVRTAPFVVLLDVNAPSVLAEISSLSSPAAEKELKKETYRDNIASYLAGGIIQYLNRQLPEGDRHYVESKSRLAEYQ